MKVVESDKIVPLFRLTMMNIPKTTADILCNDIQELVNLQSFDVDSQGWISIEERMPNVREKVLVRCESRPSGNEYVCQAYYIPGKTVDADDCCMRWDDECTEYDEENDVYWVLEGWYEQIYNWDEYSSIGIADFVTHWMVLPEMPKKTNV